MTAVATCSIDGCEAQPWARGWCNAHYKRWRKTGEVGPPEVGRRFGEAHHHWAGDRVTYLGAHLRLYRARGRADQLSCVDCEKPAQSWSYNHDAPDEKTDAAGRAYSGNPDHYSPKCYSCHATADKVTANARKVTS